MDVNAMGRRCPRSKALGLARLERHRLAVMREGWLTAVRAPWREGLVTSIVTPGSGVPLLSVILPARLPVV